MTNRVTRKRHHSETDRVASDSVGSVRPKTETESESLATRSEPSRVTISKDIEREVGGVKVRPTTLSSIFPPKTNAALSGLIARWCDLTGNVPDRTKGQTPEAMLEAYLDRLADERRYQF